MARAMSAPERRAADTKLALQLTARDYAIMDTVAQLHFVSGPQLARRHFVGGAPANEARLARHALLRLTSLDVLARLPRTIGGPHFGSTGYAYCLGLAGQRLAMQRGRQPWRRARRPRTPGTLFLRHSLLIAELHVRLSEATRAGQVEVLRLEAEPACWRTGDHGLRLKPDSYARLGIGAYEDHYFIEVDRGTEGSRTIERQLERYAAYHGSGREQRTHGVFPKTLWLTETAERQTVIAACINRLSPTARELFHVALFTDALAVLTDQKE